MSETSAFLLAFPEARFSIEVPEPLGERLPLLYPQAARVEAPENLDARFEITTARGRWALLCNGELEREFADPYLALLAFEYQLETRVVRLCRRLLAVHAGAVATSAGACIVAGNPDQGKTSTTFQLVELGHRFLSEEITLVDPLDYEVHPYLQTLNVGLPFLEDFRRTFHVEHGDLHDLHPEFLRYVPHRPAVAPAPLHTVLLPRYAADSKTWLEELGADDVVTEFLGYCFEPNIDAETLYDAVIRVLARCRLLRLTYDCAEAARAVLADLFEPATHG